MKASLLQSGDGVSGPRRVTTALLYNAAVGSLLAAQLGFAVGVLNLPQTVISGDLGVDPSGIAWTLGIISSANIAAMLGAHFAGGLADSMGRARLTFFLNLFFVAGGSLAFGAGFAKGQVGYVLLLIGRLCIGFGFGAGSVVTPMYLGEIATPSTKGAFSAIFQLTVVIFILIAQCMGLGMSTSSLWGPMLFSHAVLGGIGTLTGFFLVESPRWQLLKGRKDAARKSLLTLRGYEEEDADEEIAEMEAETGGGADEEGGFSTSRRQALSLMQLVRDSSLRPALIVAIMLQLSQQLSGINAVFFYSGQFFTNAGVDKNLGTLLVGAINVVATAASIPLIERAGRKPLILVAMVGMMVSAVGLTVALLVKAGNASLTSVLGPVSIVMVMLFVIFFELGLGAIPWAIGGELFPEESRAAAMSAAAVANWLACIIVGVFFPTIQNALGNYSFVPFAGWLALATVFTVLRVPETRGRTPAELIRALNGGREVLGSKEDGVSLLN